MKSQLFEWIVSCFYPLSCKSRGVLLLTWMAIVCHFQLKSICGGYSPLLIHKCFSTNHAFCGCSKMLYTKLITLHLLIYIIYTLFYHRYMPHLSWLSLTLTLTPEEGSISCNCPDKIGLWASLWRLSQGPRPLQAVRFPRKASLGCLQQLARHEPVMKLASISMVSAFKDPAWVFCL